MYKCILKSTAVKGWLLPNYHIKWPLLLLTLATTVTSGNLKCQRQIQFDEANWSIGQTTKTHWLTKVIKIIRIKSCICVTWTNAQNIPMKSKITGNSFAKVKNSLLPIELTSIPSANLYLWKTLDVEKNIVVYFMKRTFIRI